MKEMKIKEMKKKKKVEIMEFEEKIEVENEREMRKKEMMLEIIKKMEEKDVEIIGEGVVEVIKEGFGLMR